MGGRRRTGEHVCAAAGDGRCSGVPRSLARQRCSNSAPVTLYLLGSHQPLWSCQGHTAHSPMPRCRTSRMRVGSQSAASDSTDRMPSSAGRFLRPRLRPMIRSRRATRRRPAAVSTPRSPRIANRSASRGAYSRTSASVTSSNTGSRTLSSVAISREANAFNSLRGQFLAKKAWLRTRTPKREAGRRRTNVDG